MASNSHSSNAARGDLGSIRWGASHDLSPALQELGEQNRDQRRDVHDSIATNLEYRLVQRANLGHPGASLGTVQPTMLQVVENRRGDSLGSSQQPGTVGAKRSVRVGDECCTLANPRRQRRILDGLTHHPRAPARRMFPEAFFLFDEQNSQVPGSGQGRGGSHSCQSTADDDDVESRRSNGWSGSGRNRNHWFLSQGMSILLRIIAATNFPATKGARLLEPEIIYVLSLLVVATVMFATELLSVDIVALLLVLALVIPGVLPIGMALQGFGHPAVIGVGALFIVSEALLRTGALGLLANRLEAWSGGSEARLVLLVLIIVAGASAFLNNTPVVAMFIPVVLGISLRMGINPSHILMPLSYAAILGGTCTLIGTSTNILVSSIVSEHEGLRPLTMFEFTKLGAILTGAGLIYLYLFGRRLLPDRQTLTSMTAGPDDRRHREYVTEIGIRAGGSLVGQRFGDTVLAQTKGVRVIQLIRGEQIHWSPLTKQILREGDALVISGKIQDLMELHKQEGLATLDEILGSDDVAVSTHEAELAELLILPNSPYIGKRLEEAHFRSSFGLNVIAIQRHGMHLQNKISEHPIRVGDLLLVQGTKEGLQRVHSEEGVVLMTGVQDVLIRADKAKIAISILVLVISLMAFSNLHMATVALAGAVAMVLTGCLPAGRVYESVHWRVLVLIAGTLALGTAMETTGTATWIATNLVNLFSFAGPGILVVVFLILAALLTECVSNNAVAAVLIPIALNVPTQLAGVGIDGVSVYPFIMAVAFGASCSFLTPIGYQTNTLVYGAGGYRFTDFLRLGLPLVICIWTLGGLLIPVFWPLYE